MSLHAAWVPEGYPIDFFVVADKAEIGEKIFPGDQYQIFPLSEVDSWQEVRLEECDAAMPEMWRFTDMGYDGMEQINRFAQCLDCLLYTSSTQERSTA